MGQQPTLSFRKLVKRTATLPKSGRSKLIDPLTLAKNKVIEALRVQKSYIALVADNKSLPKNDTGREASTWFSKQTDGWWTSVRYGQQSIPFGGRGVCDMLIGDLTDVPKFYDAVAEAISNGELDAQIAELQQERSTKVAGRRATKKAA